MSSNLIHPTSLVSDQAVMGDNVTIGPYCVVGPHCKLGNDVILDSHVVIRGRTDIGAGTRIWPFASIGTEPQDLKYNNEPTQLVIGKNNSIREYVNICVGTQRGGGLTVVGDNNLFMVNSHIAHDCKVGNNCVFANGVSLAGHVDIYDNVVIGGHVACHQFIKIGELAMLAGGSIVVQDVPPYCLVHGNHANASGLNIVGLRRNGMKREQIADIKKMYKVLFQSNLPLQQAIELIASEIAPSPHKERFLTFISNTNRGICR